MSGNSQFVGICIVIEKDKERHTFTSIRQAGRFLCSQIPYSASHIWELMTNRVGEILGWRISYDLGDTERFQRKKCVVCGKDFIAYSNTKITCSKKCRDAHSEKCRDALALQKKRSRKRTSTKPLSEWLSEAAACGMTYGKYRAAIEQLGKTFEELKFEYESNRI